MRSAGAHADMDQRNIFNTNIKKSFSIPLKEWGRKVTKTDRAWGILH